jgi:hypothetical protein
MEKKILKLENVALSDKDIVHLTQNKCNVMSYADLLNYKTLDQALGQFGALCVLYETGENFGHWVAVIKVNDKLVEFFDPLSSKPDREWKYISEVYKKKPYLSHLMKESPYELSYNQYKFQKNKKGINTCGRHCSMRIILKHFTLEEYKKAFTSKEFDPDFLVTMATEILF